jgi:hypothetical protein
MRLQNAILMKLGGTINSPLNTPLDTLNPRRGVAPEFKVAVEILDDLARGFAAVQASYHFTFTFRF